MLYSDKERDEVNGMTEAGRLLRITSGADVKVENNQHKQKNPGKTHLTMSVDINAISIQAMQ